MVNIDNLFKMISEKGITQSKLAENTSISTGNISDWKRGKSMPSAVKLDELATYFGCSVDYLLGRTDKPTPAFNNVGNNNNGNQAIHGNVTVSQPQETDNRDLQLLQMIQQLSPVDYAKVILFIEEMKNKEV